MDVSDVGIKKYPVLKNYERKDWHDYEFIKYEKSRKGDGEQGAPTYLTDPEDLKKDQIINNDEGFHGPVSDKISVNRSIPDTRPEKCKDKKYFKHLPSTSVIVIYHNEWLSILLRTLHALYNRTPHELLKEIIVVDDNSTRESLNGVDRYVRDNFDDRVKVVHLQERKGLIVTRMEGAKVATGEVLVFFDSHMEVNVNWLPPLLEVIAMHPTTLVTPVIDAVSGTTFDYTYRTGIRGVYDDFMWYHWFGLRPEDTAIPDKPYQVPIMLGCAYAIRRDFFNDLGQTDEGLMIWNGEQMELSLKLHLCGGDLIEVPCSRVSHFFRNHKHHGISGIDVAARNFKRVAEVWMDDFKEVMYEADPNKRTMDAGDLSKALMVKRKLNCRPFQYFLENIAPEMYERFYYQRDYPGYFAHGAIESDAHKGQCVDTLGDFSHPVKLYKCNDVNLKNPGNHQHFKLTWHRKLRSWFRDECIKNDLWMSWCYYSKNDEVHNWKYDHKTKQLINLSKDQKCMSAKAEGPDLTMETCNSTDVKQKFTWGNVNVTALQKFDEIFYDKNTFHGLKKVVD